MSQFELPVDSENSVMRTVSTGDEFYIHSSTFQELHYIKEL